jgi:hypothetical protein
MARYNIITIEAEKSREKETGRGKTGGVVPSGRHESCW